MGSLQRIGQAHGAALADAVLGAADEIDGFAEILSGPNPRVFTPAQASAMARRLTQLEQAAAKSGNTNRAWGTRAVRNLLGSNVSKRAAQQILKRAVQPNDIITIRHSFATGSNDYTIQGPLGGGAYMFLDLHWTGPTDGSMALTKYKYQTVDWVDTTGITGTQTNSGWDLSLFAKDSTLRLGGGRFLPGNMPLFSIVTATAKIDLSIYNNASAAYGILSHLVRSNRCKPVDLTGTDSFMVGQKNWRKLAFKLGFTPDLVEGIEDGDPGALGAMFDIADDDD